jgi:hypothetical protein
VTKTPLHCEAVRFRRIRPAKLKAACLINHSLMTGGWRICVVAAAFNRAWGARSGTAQTDHTSSLRAIRHKGGAPVERDLAPIDLNKDVPALQLHPPDKFGRRGPPATTPPAARRLAARLQVLKFAVLASILLGVLAAHSLTLSRPHVLCGPAPRPARPPTTRPLLLLKVNRRLTTPP